MEYTLEPGDGATRLLLTGNLTVEHAAELKSLLMNAMDNTDHLIIDLNGVDAMDVSGIQLLCAAGRSFSKAGKMIRSSQPLSELITEVLTSAGLDPGFGCHEQFCSTCFWKGVDA